jgi:hypothetical protein
LCSKANGNNRIALHWPGYRQNGRKKPGLPNKQLAQSELQRSQAEQHEKTLEQQLEQASEKAEAGPSEPSALRRSGLTLPLFLRPASLERQITLRPRFSSPAKTGCYWER